MFPFFGSLTIIQVFQSTAISSPSHISLNISVRVSVMTSPPAFSISALTPSAPGGFPDSMLSIADFTSFAVGGSMFTGRCSSLSGMSSTSLGTSLLMMVSQYVFHRFFSTLVCIFHWNSTVFKPPASAFILQYSVAIFCICAAVSASSARFSMSALLSAFVFLFSSLSENRISGL